jgi:alkylation response protein AidB-like acyl-CoA dehydrogenase
MTMLRERPVGLEVALPASPPHGAGGFRDDDFAGKLWRIARGYEIAGGTSEVLRGNLGRRILALPRTR